MKLGSGNVLGVRGNTVKVLRNFFKFTQFLWLFPLRAGIVGRLCFAGFESRNTVETTNLCQRFC